MNVSIIVPAYNVEKYIAVCLNSLVNQSLKSIEIIVIDDGSVDRTQEIIQEFANKDARIKLIIQKNSGPSAARNKGLKIAQGEYISFVDADDYVDSDYFEKLYSNITQNNCDIAVSSLVRKGKVKNKIKLHYKNTKIYQVLDEKINACQVPKFCYACGKLYKRELIQDKFFIDGVFFEDIFWIPNVLKNSNKLVTVPDALYYYRVNDNSIVKSTPSEKKQKDYYFAKKYIIKFFSLNNLKLSEKFRNVTKKTYYFLRIPVLKIKEKNFINTCYLFSFLPIFKFRDFDAHYIFKLFFIRLAIHHKAEFNYIPAQFSGVNSDKRTPELIVSLTSYPARINYVSTTINTLLRQTVKPDRIVLWLANDEFKNKEADLPDNLIKLKDLGLEIRWCKNLYSYKKIVPALQEFPNDIIVTADDDLYYDVDWLESLYNEYLKNPSNIYVRRAVRMKISDGKIADAYKRDEAVKVNYKKASYSNQLMGGSGCLFPPHCLHSDVFDEEKIMSIIPTHDDIYLWVMAILNNTKIQVVTGFDEEMLAVEDTIESGLCKINNKSGRGMTPRDAFDRISSAYPQIIDKIKNDDIISV